MTRVLPQPLRDQIELPMVMDCFSDPVRLAIVYNLAKCADDGEMRCGDLYGLGAKSNLAYHFSKLRASGVTQTRAVGTTRQIRLRREDLDARFPGLLDAVLAAAERDAERLQLLLVDESAS